MTPAELIAARKRLDLTQSDLARVLRVGSDRTVRKWERGERPIPGPVAVLLGMPPALLTKHIIE